MIPEGHEELIRRLYEAVSVWEPDEERSPAEELAVIRKAAAATGSSRSRRGRRPSTMVISGARAADEVAKSRRKTAAERVAAEIRTMVEEANPEFTGAVLATGQSFTAMTDAGYRKITLSHGHRMTWHGQVSVGAKGNVIFWLVPEASEQVDLRKVSRIEIEHPHLLAQIGSGFVEAVTDMLGATVEELVQAETAALASDPETPARDLKAEQEARRKAAEAAKRKAEEEARLKAEQERRERDSMEDFGAWA